ncbi:unnamed protein product [Lathyrus sativus]|nr:unnamed protein product [Lathyrus sativus]
MLAVSTVSYRFNIAGRITRTMKAKRGLRQGDPISPLLFVLAMEYFHRLMHQLSRVPNYNFHAKCEKLQIIDLSFADDVLLFFRGDSESVQLLMNQLQSFSKSTGLVVNPAKCRVYFGGVNSETKTNILVSTSFTEGELPFRYLGVPLTCKRLSTHHYMSLVDRIVCRIRHWSSKLLSYAGRLQLINNTITAIAAYWMSCLPFPKHVIKTINSICRTFLWTGSEQKSRKSPIAWKMVCKPRKKGGLDVVDLSDWKVACLSKLLWNLCNKKDNLWVKWIHAFYFKTTDLMQIQEKQGMSWILKAILRHRIIITSMDNWNEMTEKYSVGKVYQFLKKDDPDVVWKHMLYNNIARPRARFTLWMACHRRLATRGRLKRLGLTTDDRCNFCDKVETIDHLLFECLPFKTCWQQIMGCLGYHRFPCAWREELEWLINHCKGKGWRKCILRSALAETIHEVWRYRNNAVFGNTVNILEIRDLVIYTLANRGWGNTKMRHHIAHLILK